MTPIFLADQLALDLVNTVVMLDGVLVDLFDTDEDVVRWLRAAGVVGKTEPLPAYRPHALVASARELRELVRELVARRKADKRLDRLDALNERLARGRQEHVLVQERGGGLVLATRFGRSTPDELLLPVALAAAELLATGDFDLVRACESEDCVLHFYDRTRSHRRRWCSMATCGNRHKVATFRERQRQSSDG